MVKMDIEPIQIVSAYVENLKHHINIKKAIIFGSAAYGKMTFDSDLDLIIVSEDFKKMEFLRRLEFLSLMRGRDFLAIPRIFWVIHQRNLRY